MLDLKKMKQQWYMQKWNAINKRKIAFDLTFEEWCDIWISSGKYEQRGIYSGQYQMCRTNDTGPYAVGNVRIDTRESNYLEAKPLKTAGTIRRWSRTEERTKQSARMSQYFIDHPEVSAKLKEFHSSDKGQEARQRNIEAIRKSRAKPVIGTNIETGEEIRIVGEKAMKEAGFNPCGISLCANGKAPKHRGFTWRFDI